MSHSYLAIGPSGSVEPDASKPTVWPGRTARPGAACSQLSFTSPFGAWASPPRRTIALRFCSDGVWLEPAASRRPCGVTASAAIRSGPPVPTTRLAAPVAVPSSLYIASANWVVEPTAIAPPTTKPSGSVTRLVMSVTCEGETSCVRVPPVPNDASGAPAGVRRARPTRCVAGPVALLTVERTSAVPSASTRRRRASTS